MDRNIFLSETFNFPPDKLYLDWLSSSAHSAFTGSPASIDASINGSFSAWDGYIWGKTLELHPSSRIVQSWRTTEFPQGAPDSQIELLFEPVEGGTKLTLIHTIIPDGQADQYEEGWQDFYFKPMKKYYE